MYIGIKNVNIFCAVCGWKDGHDMVKSDQPNVW